MHGYSCYETESKSEKSVSHVYHENYEHSFYVIVGEEISVTYWRHHVYYTIHSESVLVVSRLLVDLMVLCPIIYRISVYYQPLDEKP